MTLADYPTTHSQNLPEGSAMDTVQPMSQRSGINVGSSERWISTAAGAALVALGLSRRSIPGLLVAGAGGALVYRGVTGYCGLYSALGIDTAHGDTDGAAPEQYFNDGLHLEQSFLITNQSPDELYSFWRKLENLPRVFSHLESVTPIDERRTHWVAQGPFGMRFEWDAEIINDEPNSTIAWRSLADAQVDNAGSVRFLKASGDRGTEVKVTMDYIPPAGAAGRTIAMLLGQDPESQIREDLRRFKRTIECGVTPSTDGQSRGNCAG